jgi:putative NIF3 family GTP cyclohydrolase 1 type 2
MKLKEIHEFFVNEGKKVDPRGLEAVEKLLKKRAEAFKELKEDEKEELDKESLWNPYADCRIYHGSGNEEVSAIMVGIDMEGSELLLANELKKQGKKLDLVLAHHPEGKALASLYAVMALQEDVLHQYGVPINLAEGLMNERILEVEKGLSPINHMRSVDFARILNIPFMNTHTTSDNHVQKFLLELFDEKKPETLEDLVKVLKEIPEYKKAIKHDAGPKIFLGTPKNRCGKIIVDMTGGTEGHEKSYEALAKAGVGTVVAMHVGKEMRKPAEENKVNLVVAGHIASDTLGLNLLFDKLEKKQKFEFIECSGFNRVRRNK